MKYDKYRPEPGHSKRPRQGGQGHEPNMESLGRIAQVMSNVNAGPVLHHDTASQRLPALAAARRSAEGRTLGDVKADLERELALLEQSNREALSAAGLERLVTAGRETRCNLRQR